MRIIDLDTHIGPNDQWDYLPDEFRTMRPIQVFDRLGRTVRLTLHVPEETRDQIDARVQLSSSRKQQLLDISIRRFA